MKRTFMSEWRDAARRELGRYYRRTGERVVSTQELMKQAEHRFKEQFPGAETPDRTLSKALGELIERDELERPDEGKFGILRDEFDDETVSSLDEMESELLDRYKQALEESYSAEHYRLREHNYHDEAVGGARNFIADPSIEKFRGFWGFLHSATRMGTPEKIHNKWLEGGRSDQELATLIEEILESDEYDPGWENTLGAQRTIRELYGVFHIDSHPILNNSAVAGLSIFGYPNPRSYRDGELYFNDFKVDYETAIGHVREDIAPLNLEIDQLFNVLHKVNEEDIEDADSEAEAALYRQAVRLKKRVENGGPEPIDPKDLATVPGQIWQMSPGEREYGLWPAMRDAGVIAMGYGRGDLSEQTVEEIEESTDKGDSMAISFAKDIEIGDVIVGKKGTSKELYGVGVVERSAYHDPDLAEELYPEHAGHDNFVDVDWILDFEEEDGDWVNLPDLDGNFHQWTLRRFPEDRYQNLIEVIEQSYPDHVSGFTEIKERSQELARYEVEPSPGHPPEIRELSDKVGSVDFYWINQKDPEEHEGSSFQNPFSGRLQAPADDNDRHALDKLEEGDIAIHYYESQLLGYSEVESAAQVVEIDGEQKYRVNVDPRPFDEPIPRDEFGQLVSRDAEGFDDLPMFLNGYQGYLYELPDPAAELVIDCLHRRFEIEHQPTDQVRRLTERLSLPDLSPSLPGDLYFEDEDSLRREIRASLNSEKNIIFTGPPGTGKSELAEHISREQQENGHIDEYVFSTATAEWTAYDTIGGYMPGKDREDGSLEFNPGQFLRCFRAEDATIVNNWLIIDEINRADIDKAFGQLFSVLSEDSVDLPYEREEPIRIEWVADEARVPDIATNEDTYPVTPAWRLIGTMNTADKTSLYEMSFAFMRRFNFIHVGIPDLVGEDGQAKASLLRPPGPDEDHVENYATAWQGSLSDPNSFIEILDNLHSSIAVVWANLDEKRPIGPAIIFDIVRYVEEYVDNPLDDDELTQGLTRAIISLVYPQLEGMRPDEQKSLIKNLPETRAVDVADGPSNMPNSEILKRKAEDMFAITFEDDDES